MFLGQSESLYVTKSYLPKAKDSVIFATLVGGMSSISVSVMGLYVSMGARSWKWQGCKLYWYNDGLCFKWLPRCFRNISSPNGFLSMVALINNFIGIFNSSITLEGLVGYIFYPFALLMGSSSREEVPKVAQLLGTQLVTNEAVAFALPQFNELTVRTKAL